MSIERFKEAVRIIGARHDSGHSNVAHNPLYIASTSNGDGELHLDDMREVLAEVERLREDRDRVARTLSIVLGVSFEHARDLPEKCSIGQMLPLQRAEKAEADNERLREALRSYGAHAPDCGDAHGCTCGYSAALAGKEKP